MSMETREYCNETVMGKYTKNDLLKIFGLNPDINEIIIKYAITYIIKDAITYIIKKRCGTSGCTTRC